MSKEKNNPGLDEQTFAKLLEAAYVLQEHNREMRQMEESLELHSEELRQQEAETQAALLRSARRAEESSRPPDPDYVLTLAEIVEAQHQIQIRHLESDNAMAVVAERVTRITNASGAGIGIQDGKIIRYRAGAGASALPVGSEVPLEKAICTICVRTGQVLRTPDVNTEFLFDPDLCRVREIQSLVAVPIYHDGNIVGALELYFDRLNGFVEQDIHTCQLMAGLVTEAIGRAAGSALKKSVAAERASMLAASEKLQPNAAGRPERDEGDGREVEVRQNDPSSAIGGKTSFARTDSAAASAFCWKCGSRVVTDEQFCGKCGAPRVGETDPATTQSKLASALQMQEASPLDSPPLEGAFGDGPPANPIQRTRQAAQDPTVDGDSLSPASDLKNENLPPRHSIAASADKEIDPKPPLGLQRGRIHPAPATLMASQQEEATWSSAAKARDFLETLAETRSPSALARFWHARRGDFYLAVAVILVLVVIRWGILSNHPVGATGAGPTASGSPARRRPADDLSLYDKLLISLGLAEPPETPEYKGNPNTQVWIDTHTALYYCPGSELYGKTPKGKFASQHDAQLDQFESASRRACD